MNVRNKLWPKKPVMPPEPNLLKLYIQIGVLKYSERDGKSFTTKFDRMKKLCWKQDFQIDFKLIFNKIDFQGVSRPYDQTTSPIDTKFETL
jgi:hypothetical protein